jgi:HAD superfamily hydrolase (TIGR01662 family)
MLTLLIGYQGSTKSTYAVKLAAEQNATILSRDDAGGKLSDLLPAVKKHLQENKNVILDNTHLTKESRKPFISLAKELAVTVHAIHIDSPIEDCQIRVLHRMYSTYEEIFFTGKGTKKTIKTIKAEKDPHVFPISVLFAARKNFEAPSTDEGWTSIKKIKVPSPTFSAADGYVNKALFLDIDGTVRETEHLENKYPVRPDECVLIKERTQMRKKLDKYIADGYQLIGVSNQSGISKSILTEEQADSCFDKTRELLGYTEDQFPIIYCPHRSVPISCYCRKPQSGLGVWAIETYRLAPQECIMVGDRGTDRTFAERLGVKFIEASKFW